MKKVIKNNWMKLKVINMILSFLWIKEFEAETRKQIFENKNQARYSECKNS